MAELERQLESARRESLDWETEATVAWAEGQCVAERATAAEWGLEAVKPHRAKTKAELQTSRADTEVAL